MELHSVDRDRFPLYQKATPFKCIVEPGDLLYIPAYWWHSLLTLQTSISVNYWYDRFAIPREVQIKNLVEDQIIAYIQKFIEAGFSPNHQNINDESLLVEAVRKGYVNVVNALLRCGANPHVKDSAGKSALSLAKEKQNIDIQNALLVFGGIADAQRK